VPARTGATLALDVGGTKLAAGVVDEAGSVRGRTVVATPLDADADGLLATLVATAEDALAAAGKDVVDCGVGCGGPMSGGTVSPLNIPAWRGFPLAARLTDALALPTVVDNDAKALALGEGWRGGASGVDNFLAMVVSTGVGGGLVLDGRLLDGRLGNAGHVGHVVVEPDGRRCVCGGRGCLEAEAAGPAIEALTGAPAAAADDAVRVRTGVLVGRAVASVANLLDLDLVLVGGSVALGFGDTFFEAARGELAARARLAFSRACRLEPVRLGELAPLVGAAALARRAREGWAATT
jgi:glucokinase